MDLSALKQILLTKFKEQGRGFAAAIFVWSLGYLNVSIGWLLAGLFVHSIWKSRKSSQKQKGKILERIVADDKAFVTTVMRELPSWVTFPDQERANWLNSIVKQLWPFLGVMVKSKLKEKVEPGIRKKLPSFLKSFYFDEINLGGQAPQLGGIKAYAADDDRREIIIDCEVIYHGNASIKVAVKGITAGVTSIQLRGDLRIVLGPLLPHVPLVGAVSLFFLSSPDISFDLTDLLNLLDTPGLSDVLRGCVEEAVDNMIVLPNKVFIPLTELDVVESLRYPRPAGVIRLTVHEATDLDAKDINLFKTNSSDPYAIIHVGANEFRTETRKCTLEPKWNETFEVIADSKTGQRMNIFLFDEDTGSYDEPLGRAEISVDTIVENKSIDTWLPLEGSEKGQIRIECRWHEISNDVTAIKQPQEEKEISSALLAVKLDSAANLPVSDKSQSCVFCRVIVGNKTFETKAKNNTSNPVWQEMFRCFIFDPKYQECSLQVIDQTDDETLGVLDFDLSRLLEAKEMTIDQEFELKKSDITSRINACFQLWAVGNSQNIPNISTDDGNGNEGLRKRKPTSSFGSIKIDIRWQKESNKLIIHVIKAENLVGHKSNKSISPFVAMQLLPDNTDYGMREGKPKKNTSDPDFDETFQYFIGYEELRKRVLKVQIKDDEDKNQTIIGYVNIDMAEDVDLELGDNKWYRLESASKEQ